MDEVVPIILGFIGGIVIWRKTVGRMRMPLSVLIVLVSGALATLLSGEYLESWVYVLLDIGEAIFGLVVGLAAARFSPSLRSRLKRARARP
jgi:hypothetical protein